MRYHSISPILPARCAWRVAFARYRLPPKVRGQLEYGGISDLAVACGWVFNRRLASRFVGVSISRSSKCLIDIPEDVIEALEAH